MNHESDHFHNGLDKYRKMFQHRQGYDMVSRYLHLLTQEAKTSYWRNVLERYRVELEKTYFQGEWV